MELANDIVSYFSTAIICFISFALWRRYSKLRSRREFLLLAVAFTFLSIIAISGYLIPETENPSLLVDIIGRCEIILLLAFPYFLYLFTKNLARGRISRYWDYIFATLSLACAVFTIFAPLQEEESYLFLAFLVLFLLQWCSILLFVSVKLWLAGRGKTTMIQKRLQTLSVASAFLLLTLLISPFVEKSEMGSLISSSLGLISIFAFYIGFITPPFLRNMWRIPEQMKTRQAMAKLMQIETVKEIEEEFLPTTADIVGGHAAAIIDHEGNIIAVHNQSEKNIRKALERSDPWVTNLDFPFGKFLVWSNPYTPVLGEQETELLSSVGAVVGLALERCRSLAKERETTEKLRELNHLKDEFVAMASHELRTPLTSIIGFTSTLKDHKDYFSEEQKDEFLNIIDEQSHRLNRLVEDLLTLSRIESGKLKVNPTLCLPQEIIEKAAFDLSFSELEIASSTDAEIFVDIHHLHQIITNYLTNAVRYGNEPYTVFIDKEGDEIVIRVTDKGEGPEEELIPHLFERFAVGASSEQGTGLGLAIVSELAQAHDGRVWHETYKERNCFGVAFPVAK